MSHGGSGNGALIASMCMGVAGYFAYNVTKKLWKGVQSNQLQENDPVIDTDLPPHYPKRQRLVYHEDINDLSSILEDLNISGLDVNQIIKPKSQKVENNNNQKDNNDDEYIDDDDDYEVEQDRKPETIQEGDEDAGEEADEQAAKQAFQNRQKGIKNTTRAGSQRRQQQQEDEEYWYEDECGDEDEDYADECEEAELTSQALELTPFAKFSLAKLTSHTPSINSELRAEWENTTWKSLAEGHIMRERRRLRKQKKGPKRVPKQARAGGHHVSQSRQSDHSQDQDEVMSSVSNPREGRRPPSSNGDNTSEKKTSSVTSSSRNNASQQDKSEGRREREREREFNNNNNNNNNNYNNNKSGKNSTSRRRRTKRKRGMEFRNQSASTSTTGKPQGTSTKSKNFVPLACQQSLRSRTVWKKVQGEESANAAQTASKSA